VRGEVWRVAFSRDANIQQLRDYRSELPGYTEEGLKFGCIKVNIMA
jgi:hypothetical protein